MTRTRTEPEPEPTVFVGIDVSKAHRDVAVRPAGAAVRLDNTPAGTAERSARLTPLAPALIVPEATGGDELAAAAAGQAAGLPCRSPRSTRGRPATSPGGRPTGPDRPDRRCGAGALRRGGPAHGPPGRARRARRRTRCRPAASSSSR